MAPCTPPYGRHPWEWPESRAFSMSAQDDEIQESPGMGMDHMYEGYMNGENFEDFSGVEETTGTEEDSAVNDMSDGDEDMVDTDGSLNADSEYNSNSLDESRLSPSLSVRQLPPSHIIKNSWHPLPSATRIPIFHQGQSSQTAVGTAQEPQRSQIVSWSEDDIPPSSQIPRDHASSSEADTQESELASQTAVSEPLSDYSDVESEALEHCNLTGFSKAEFKELWKQAPPEERQSFKELLVSAAADTTHRGLKGKKAKLDSTTDDLPPELLLPVLREHVWQYISAHQFWQNTNTSHHTINQRRRFTRDLYDCARAVGLDKKHATKEISQAKQVYIRGARWRKILGEPQMSNQQELLKRLHFGEPMSVDESDSDYSAWGTEIDDMEEILNTATNLEPGSDGASDDSNELRSAKAITGNDGGDQQDWIKTRKSKGTRSNRSHGRQSSLDHVKIGDPSETSEETIFREVVLAPESSKRPTEGSHPMKHQSKRRRRKEKAEQINSAKVDTEIEAEPRLQPYSMPKTINDAVNSPKTTLPVTEHDKKSRKRKRMAEASVPPPANVDETELDAIGHSNRSKHDSASNKVSSEKRLKKKHKHKNADPALQHVAVPQNTQTYPPITENTEDAPKVEGTFDRKAAKRQRKEDKKRRAAEREQTEAEVPIAIEATETALAKAEKQQRKEARAKRKKQRRVERSLKLDNHAKPVQEPQQPQGSSSPPLTNLQLAAQENPSALSLPLQISETENTEAIKPSRKNRTKSKSESNLDEGSPQHATELAPTQNKGPNDPDTEDQAHLNFLKAIEKDPHVHVSTTDKSSKELKKALDNEHHLVSGLTSLTRFSNDKQVEAFDHGLHKNADKQTIHDIEDQREGTMQEKGIDPGSGKSAAEAKEKRQGKKEKELRRKERRLKEKSKGDDEMKGKTDRVEIKEEDPDKMKVGNIDHEVTQKEDFHTPMIHQN